MKVKSTSIIILSVLGVIFFIFIIVPPKVEKKKGSKQSANSFVSDEIQINDKVYLNNKNIVTDDISPKNTQDWELLTNSTVRWQERVRKLRGLDFDEISNVDIYSLYNLLRYQPDFSEDFEAWYVVANEIMEQCRLHGLAKERFSDEMLELIGDNGVDNVIRDYAIQHLGLWFLPKGAKEFVHYEESSEKIEKSINLLMELTTDSTLMNTSIPGTALRVFVEMKKSNITNLDLDSKLLELKPYFSQNLVLLNDVEYYRQFTPYQRANTISIINTVSELEFKEFSGIIRKIAQDVDLDPGLRLNSIAALGRLGSEDDIPYLEEVITNVYQDHERYRFAAQTALKHLKQ